MNITYIIGNGFDINLGLKSRYVDFYKDYIKRTAIDGPVIQIFRDEINEFVKQDCNKKDENTIDWQDLEVALGHWTEKLKVEEVEPLYINIIDSLKDYLEGEYESFDLETFSRVEFFSYLLDPISENYNRNQITEIQNFWRGFSEPDDINIINFNYTTTIEHLSSYTGDRLYIGENTIGHKTYLNSVLHIHQSLNDEEILVGLNDVSQIANKEIHKDKHLCNLLIKPRTNVLLGTGVDRDCESVIRKTHLFIIFGTSAGITDKKWWNSICTRLQNDSVRLLYFVYCPDDVKHIGIRYDVMSEKALRSFVQSAGIKDTSFFETISSKSYVCFKSKLFKLSVSYDDRFPIEKKYQFGRTEVVVSLQDKGVKYVSLIIDAPDEKAGVLAERRWINEFFPGAIELMQSLSYYSLDGKELPFDTIMISYKGKNKNIYFDISSFYGKNDNYEIASIPMERRKTAFVEEIRNKN